METTGQQIAKLLTLMGAMLGGTMIQTSAHSDGVEVLAIMRDNYEGAPVYVRLQTADGQVTLPVEHVSLIEADGEDDE